MSVANSAAFGIGGRGRGSGMAGGNSKPLSRLVPRARDPGSQGLLRMELKQCERGFQFARVHKNRELHRRARRPRNDAGNWQAEEWGFQRCTLKMRAARRLSAYSAGPSWIPGAPEDASGSVPVGNAGGCSGWRPGGSVGKTSDAGWHERGSPGRPDPSGPSSGCPLPSTRIFGHSSPPQRRGGEVWKSGPEARGLAAGR